MHVHMKVSCLFIIYLCIILMILFKTTKSINQIKKINKKIKTFIEISC